MKTADLTLTEVYAAQVVGGVRPVVVLDARQWTRRRDSNGETRGFLPLGQGGRTIGRGSVGIPVLPMPLGETLDTAMLLDRAREIRGVFLGPYAGTPVMPALRPNEHVSLVRPQAIERTWREHLAAQLAERKRYVEMQEARAAEEEHQFAARDRVLAVVGDHWRMPNSWSALEQICQSYARALGADVPAQRSETSP